MKSKNHGSIKFNKSNLYIMRVWIWMRWQKVSGESKCMENSSNLLKAQKYTISKEKKS